MLRVSTLVRQLYRGNPHLVDSDRKLLLAYWESEGLYLDALQRDRFMRTTAAETITRAARKLRSTGEFRASHAVEEERYHKFKTFQEGWFD